MPVSPGWQLPAAAGFLCFCAAPPGHRVVLPDGQL